MEDEEDYFVGKLFWLDNSLYVVKSMGDAPDGAPIEVVRVDW